ncbi:MAG TPA: hypothetical protein VFT84_16580 [Gemmatimonadales bacterium]|nr:hypothetical protein [Gemmatimonadales bacterium]
MRRSILVTGLSALALLACRDTPPSDAPPAAEASAAPAPAPAAGGGGQGADAGQSGSTPIEITASVDGREVSATGLGECQHAADGSIYERPAALWIARFDGADADAVRHLSIAFWREATGAESVTMAIETESGVQRIATVPGAERHGSATVRLDGDAAAGTLVIEGRTAEGKALRLRARCARFTPLVAEGG